MPRQRSRAMLSLVQVPAPGPESEARAPANLVPLHRAMATRAALGRAVATAPSIHLAPTPGTQAQPGTRRRRRVWAPARDFRLGFWAGRWGRLIYTGGTPGWAYALGAVIGQRWTLWRTDLSQAIWRARGWVRQWDLAASWGAWAADERMNADERRALAFEFGMPVAFVLGWLVVRLGLMACEWAEDPVSER